MDALSAKAKYSSQKPKSVLAYILPRASRALCLFSIPKAPHFWEILLLSSSPARLLPVSMLSSPIPFVAFFQALLTVLSAKGLAKADLCGNSDPFAVVLLNRQEIGRTRTMFKTNNPVWSNPRETFPVRVRGNKTRCSIVVQLWDEDPGRPSRLNILASDITQPFRVACITHESNQNSELIMFRLHLP